MVSSEPALTISASAGFSANSNGIVGNSTNGNGVFGTSTNGYGVAGSSPTSTAVYGNSTSGYGVQGVSSNTTGVYGSSTKGYGVFGTSVDNIGISGFSANSTGIVGNSTNGTGIFGTSANGLAGDFSGLVRMTGFKLTNAPQPGYVLTSDGNGNGTWQKSPSNGVFSLNSLQGALTLAAGSNVTLTQSGNTITVSVLPVVNPTRMAVTLGDTGNLGSFYNIPIGNSYIDITMYRQITLYFNGSPIYGGDKEQTAYMPLAASVPAGTSISINFYGSPPTTGFALYVRGQGGNSIPLINLNNLSYPSVRLVSDGRNTWTQQ